MIKFNVPYLTGNESKYISEVLQSRHLSGDGIFTKKCDSFFENKWVFAKCLLTTSCTDALEMAALLLEVKPGDEVIMPSYTFVSTSNAFALRGAKIIFADSSKDNPNIDAASIEALITPRTKAIVVVHYAGIACDMDIIMEIANKHKLFVVEDAAQAIDSYYKGKPLGSIGHLAAFSFHETKNVQCGEGGMLIINDTSFFKRAEIIREKGTNRSAFFRGEIDKYGWVDIGSSFLPSEILAAFLYAQLESIENTQKRRKEIWQQYYDALKPLEKKGIQLPYIPNYATNNGHMFYLVCNSLEERTGLTKVLKDNEIHAVFHYQSLHKSVFIKEQNYQVNELPYCEKYTDCLLRLPLYYELSNEQINFVSEQIINFCN